MYDEIYLLQNYEIKMKNTQLVYYLQGNIYSNIQKLREVL